MVSVAAPFAADWALLSSRFCMQGMSETTLGRAVGQANECLIAHCHLVANAGHADACLAMCQRSARKNAVACHIECTCSALAMDTQQHIPICSSTCVY